MQDRPPERPVAFAHDEVSTEDAAANEVPKQLMATTLAEQNVGWKPNSLLILRLSRA